MLRAAVDDVGSGDKFEQLWSEKVGEGLFEICCIPFFVYDLALGDVVRAEAESGCLVRSVARRSGNGVVRVAVKRREDVEPVHDRLHDLLARTKYLCEWFAPGYVAISVEPGRSHNELFEGLDELGDAIEVERILI
jgi:hypothetical protein